MLYLLRNKNWNFVEKKKNGTLSTEHREMNAKNNLEFFWPMSYPMFYSPATFTEEFEKHIQDLGIVSKTLCKFDLFHADQLIAHIIIDSNVTFKSLLSFLEDDLKCFFGPRGSIFHQTKALSDKSLNHVPFSEMSIFSIIDEQRSSCVFRQVVIYPIRKQRDCVSPDIHHNVSSPTNSICENSQYNKGFSSDPLDSTENEFYLPDNAVYKIVYKKINCQLCGEELAVKFISNMLFMGKVCQYCYLFLRQIKWS